MTELFTNIPTDVKKQHSEFIDFIFLHYDAQSAAKIILEYVKTCIDIDEQEFIDFYFNLKMEQLLHENSNDISEESTR